MEIRLPRRQGWGPNRGSAAQLGGVLGVKSLILGCERGSGVALGLH